MLAKPRSSNGMCRSLATASSDESFPRRTSSNSFFRAFASMTGYDLPSIISKMSAVTNATRMTLTVGVTGASGSILPRHLLDALERDERVGTVNLILSDSGLRVMAEELGVSGRSEIIGKLLGRPPV